MEIKEIYNQYYDRIREYVSHLVRNESVADDIAQETFLRVITNLHSVKDPNKIIPWIYRIAHNLCMDYIRRNKGISLDEQPWVEDSDAADCTPMEKELEQQQMSSCVQRQMDLLPENQRTVLILRDTMEFTEAETAAILGITLENVKVRLHRARKMLREILTRRCDFERDERSILVCVPR